MQHCLAKIRLILRSRLLFHYLHYNCLDHEPNRCLKKWLQMTCKGQTQIVEHNTRWKIGYCKIIFLPCPLGCKLWRIKQNSICPSILTSLVNILYRELCLFAYSLFTKNLNLVPHFFTLCLQTEVTETNSLKKLWCYAKLWTATEESCPINVK